MVHRVGPFGGLARAGEGRRSAGLWPGRRHRRLARAADLRGRGHARQRTGAAAARLDGDRRQRRAVRGQADRVRRQHAPAKQFDELVEAAKADPAFLAQQAAVKAAYRADHIEKAVARGEPREEVEKEFERVTRAAARRSASRIWRELSPHQSLYSARRQVVHRVRDGGDPAGVPQRECADPVEGMDYQSRNPG